MATAGTDARFSHLLEPIRDLAQNWSIDIAAEVRMRPHSPVPLCFLCSCVEALILYP